MSETRDAADAKPVGAEPPPPASLRAGLVATAAALRAMGPMRRGLADAVGLAAYAFDGRRRRNAIANHRRLGAPSESEVRRRARASFREYARTNVDFIWANRMSAADVASRSRIIGIEHVDAAIQDGRGAILALSHFGNWDFAALMAWAYGLQLTTVMAPVGNETITRLVVWAREENALEVFTPERAARGLLRALRRARFVALLCDVPETGPVTTVRFCGGPAEFSLAPAWLAIRTGAPLFAVDCRRGDRGEPEYVITVQPRVEPLPGEDAPALTQRLAALLESAVRAHPEQWYPFRPGGESGAS